MALLEWSDNYSVGVELFDRQHKKLIDLINELNESMKKGEGKAKVGDIIDKLLNYAAEHFKSEEDYFSQYGYPEEQEHRKQHKSFVEDVTKFKLDFDRDKLFLSIEVMNFLKDWLIKHILDSDKNYSDFFASKGVN